jgi:hypothetical protein
MIMRTNAPIFIYDHELLKECLSSILDGYIGSLLCFTKNHSLFCFFPWEGVSSETSPLKVSC